MFNLRTGLLLTGALLGAALAPLGSSSIAVAIPIMAGSLETDTAIVTQLLVGGYLFISVVGQIPGGRFADRFGALPVLSIGLIIYAAGCLLGFLTENLMTLTVSRMSMALGTAFIGPATGALIRLQIPVRNLPMAFGIFGTTMSGAAAIGPWVGGLVVSQQHWSWIFAINLPLAALSALLIFLSIDKSAMENRRALEVDDAIDWLGIVILAIAVGSLQAALAYQSLLVLTISGFSFYFFYHHERQHPAPLLHSSLFESRIFISCCAITGLNNFTLYAVLFQVPVLLIVLGTEDPLFAGTVLLAMTIAMMACGPISALIAARIGHRTTLVIAQLFGLSGLGSLVHFTPTFGDIAVIPSIAMLGVSVGMTMPLIQSAAISSVPSSRAGAATGGSGTARYIGGALGIATMTMVLASGNDLSTHIELFYIYSVAVVAIIGISLTLPQALQAAD